MLIYDHSIRSFAERGVRKLIVSGFYTLRLSYKYRYFQDMTFLCKIVNSSAKDLPRYLHVIDTLIDFQKDASYTVFNHLRTLSMLATLFTTRDKLCEKTDSDFNLYALNSRIKLVDYTISGGHKPDEVRKIYNLEIPYAKKYVICLDEFSDNDDFVGTSIFSIV